jgi:hypothetical protein
MIITGKAFRIKNRIKELTQVMNTSLRLKYVNHDSVGMYNLQEKEFE